MERTESLSAIMMVKSGLGSTLKRIQVLLHTIDTDLFFFVGQQLIQARTVNIFQIFNAID